MANPQEAQLAALREELSTEFNAYSQRIIALESQVQTLVARPHSHKKVLPDPPKFSGSAGDFDFWLLEMDGKMAVDGQSGALGNEQAQFRYWFSRLDTKPQKVVAPHVRHAEKTNNWDYTVMRKTLQRINDDPLKHRKASAALRDLKQGDFSLHSFLNKWETLAGESGHATLDDEVRIGALRHAVCNKLQYKLEVREVQFGSLPTTYDDFVALLHKINSGVTIAPKSGGHTGPTSGHNGPTPMDLSAVDIHEVDQSQQPSAQQRRKWFAEGKCRGCGSEDHKLAQCTTRNKLSVAVLEEQGKMDRQIEELTHIQVNAVEVPTVEGSAGDSDLDDLSDGIYSDYDY